MGLVWASVGTRATIRGRGRMFGENVSGRQAPPSRAIQRRRNVIVIICYVPFIYRGTYSSNQDQISPVKLLKHIFFCVFDGATTTMVHRNRPTALLVGLRFQDFSPGHFFGCSRIELFESKEPLNALVQSSTVRCFKGQISAVLDRANDCLVRACKQTRWTSGTAITRRRRGVSMLLFLHFTTQEPPLLIGSQLTTIFHITALTA